jgi:hypothetical protein
VVRPPIPYAYAGGKYEGYFKNDKMNGRGIMSYADGKRYEVEYEFGVEIRRRPLVQRREELRRRLLKKMEQKNEGKSEEKDGVSGAWPVLVWCEFFFPIHTGVSRSIWLIKSLLDRPSLPSSSCVRLLPGCKGR